MDLFLRCKQPNCGGELKPPEPSKAEAEYRYEELKGWCPDHEWQTLTLDEQDEMMHAIRRESKSALA